LTPAKPLKS